MPIDPTADLYKSADDLEGRAAAGETQVRTDTDAEMQRRAAERKSDTDAYMGAAKDVESTIGKRPQVPMPNPDLGPPVDPKQTKDLAFQLLTMGLIGAAAGRGHWKQAVAGITGMVEGFKEGNDQKIKEKKAQFDREYKIAVEKQAQADKQYQDILQSKSLSMNMMAKMIEIHATANADWDMAEKARMKDFDGMYRRADVARQRADRMTSAKESLDLKWAEFNQKKEQQSNKVLDDNTLHFMAKQYLSGDKTVFQNLGRGAQGAENVVNLRRMIPSVAQELGMKPEDVARKIAEFSGLMAAQRTLGTRQANMDTAAYEARGFADLAKDAAAKVWRSEVVPLNKLVEKFQEGTATPEQRQFVVANRSLINAYSQVASRSSAKNIHDTVEAEKMLMTADGPEAYRAGVDQLLKEIDIAIKAPGQTRASLREGGLDAGTGTGKPSMPTTNAKGWALMTDKNGNKAYVSPDGKQFEEAQ